VKVTEDYYAEPMEEKKSNTTLIIIIVAVVVLIVLCCCCVLGALSVYLVSSPEGGNVLPNILKMTPVP
jgi:flagellar basal body-associated protein FliL